MNIVCVVKVLGRDIGFKRGNPQSSDSLHLLKIAGTVLSVGVDLEVSMEKEKKKD